MNKVDLKEMTICELETFLGDIGEKKFRAKQIFAWIYKNVSDFEQMTDLSGPLRARLSEMAFIGGLRQERVQISAKDNTRKYVFVLADGNIIESVFMQYRHGNSVCISSQAGCRMGCSFCASALLGLDRNLTAGEMIDQVLAIQKDTNQKVSNIVVMGTGEPFDNYDNLSRFLRLANAKEGLGIGMRSITVSTCGLLPKIKAFAEDFPQAGLAVSLHGSNDALRRALMPIHKSYTMDELISTCKWYTEKTRRRITFEYALISEVNDKTAHAAELAKRLRGILCHVNLIPLNGVHEKEYKGSAEKTTTAFKKILEESGIPVSVRRELGSDIDGACGQLRAKIRD